MDPDPDPHFFSVKGKTKEGHRKDKKISYRYGITGNVKNNLRSSAPDPRKKIRTGKMITDGSFFDGPAYLCLS